MTDGRRWSLNENGLSRAAATTAAASAAAADCVLLPYDPPTPPHTHSQVARRGEKCSVDDNCRHFLASPKKERWWAHERMIVHRSSGPPLPLPFPPPPSPSASDCC